MFIDKDSLIINGVSMGNYIVQAEYQYNKLWSSDSRKKFGWYTERNVDTVYSQS